MMSFHSYESHVEEILLGISWAQRFCLLASSGICSNLTLCPWCSRSCPIDKIEEWCLKLTLGYTIYITEVELGMNGKAKTSPNSHLKINGFLRKINISPPPQKRMQELRDPRIWKVVLGVVTIKMFQLTFGSCPPRRPTLWKRGQGNGWLGVVRGDRRSGSALWWSPSVPPPTTSMVMMALLPMGMGSWMVMSVRLEMMEGKITASKSWGTETF